MIINVPKMEDLENSSDDEQEIKDEYQPKYTSNQTSKMTSNFDFNQFSDDL